jgi:hypothetical protein
MFRKANEPFTWSPVYAPSDVCGFYIRSRNVWRDYAAAERAEYEAAKRTVVGFYTCGETLRPGAEPVLWQRND